MAVLEPLVDCIRRLWLDEKPAKLTMAQAAFIARKIEDCPNPKLEVEEAFNSMSEWEALAALTELHRRRAKTTTSAMT